MNGQLIHERSHQVVGGEVKDQAEGYGDGKSRKGLFEDRQEQKSQTQTLRRKREDQSGALEHHLL